MASWDEIIYIFFPLFFCFLCITETTKKLYFRSETCIKIALAIKEEVEDLEAAGIQVSLHNWLCLIQYLILLFYFLFISIYLVFLWSCSILDSRSSKLMSQHLGKGCLYARQNMHTTWIGQFTLSELPTLEA